MKTKITNISPDQNIIEHESGLKTVFVKGCTCENCEYRHLNADECLMIPCYIDRIDSEIGNFIKLTDHENN